MLKELDNYGTLLSYGGPESHLLQLADLLINDSNFNPSDPTRRPAGWGEVRMNRVRVKESVAGADPNTVQLMRPAREANVSYVTIHYIYNDTSFYHSTIICL
jgi:hypothetical protein